MHYIILYINEIKSVRMNFLSPDKRRTSYTPPPLCFTLIHPRNTDGKTTT